MLTTPRFWRVEHPSWSVIYRVPEWLGPRPDAASVEIHGHAVAFTEAGNWYFLVNGFGERWVATVRIAPWPRRTAPPPQTPTRFVVDAAVWTALAPIARGVLRDAADWSKAPGVMRSELVERVETLERIRAVARAHGVAIEEERDS